MDKLQQCTEGSINISIFYFIAFTVTVNNHKTESQQTANMKITTSDLGTIKLFSCISFLLQIHLNIHSKWCSSGSLSLSLHIVLVLTLSTTPPLHGGCSTGLGCSRAPDIDPIYKPCLPWLANRLTATDVKQWAREQRERVNEGTRVCVCVYLIQPLHSLHIWIMDLKQRLTRNI